MYRLISILLFSLLLFSQANGQVHIKKYYYLDSNSSWDIHTIEDAPFVPYESDLQKGFTSNTVWVKLEISTNVFANSLLNEVGTYPLTLRVGSLTLDSIKYYEKYRDSWYVQQLGDQHMVYPRVCADDVHCFNIKSHLEKPIIIFLEIRSKNILQVSTEVVAQKDLGRIVANKIRVGSIALAFALCLCIVSLIFFVLEKSRLIIFYVFFQLSIILYITSTNGLLFDIFEGQQPFVTNYSSEFFFYLRALMFCILCNEIFINYKTTEIYKKINHIFYSLFFINLAFTFLNFGYINTVFNLTLQAGVLTLNFYAIRTTQLPNKIKYSALAGNIAYSLILFTGFLYSLNFFNVDKFNFLIHDFRDYRLHGIPIGIVVFSIVTFQILEKNKKNIEIVNEANENRIKINLLNDKLTEREALVDLLTHEIKNPLSTINYAASFIQKNNDQNTEISDRVRKITHSTARIDSVVNQVYLSSRLDRFEQSNENQHEYINFNELLSNIISDYEFSNAFTFKSQSSFKIHSNRFLLSTILNNLISNAVKYNVPESPISITLTHIDSALNSQSNSDLEMKQTLCFEITNKFDIENTPDPDKIFKRYYRHDNFFSKPGMGIGLNIVKMAINILNGDINYSIHSDSITFKFVIAT